MLSETERLGDDPVPWGPGAALSIWAAGFFGSAIWVTFLNVLNSSNAQLPRSVPWLFLGQLVLWAAYGIAPILLARRYGGSLVERFKLFVNARDMVLWGVGGLLAQVVVIPLVYVPLRSLIDPDDVGDAAEDLIEIATSYSDAIVLFVMIVLIAPVVEELFFRGTVLPALESRLGVWPAIVLSSLWFAASHLQVIQFPGLLAIGLLLAYCRHRTRSLMPAIAMHMVFNGVTFGVLLSTLELT